MALTALIPAHNEADNLAGTILSLQGQTCPPDRILVVSDNSTDATVDTALSLGVEAIETVGNTFRKAGALNQGLKLVQTDLVMCIDADTQLAPTFIERALRELRNSEVGAVGGVFTGRRPKGLLELAQSAEYSRYAEHINHKNKVMVLSGTAAVIRMSALEGIAAARGSLLPGRKGDVYDRAALTEDSELTMALKSMGWKLLSPIECRCDTELMPTLRTLHNQRLRWYRGAIENVLSYGLTRVSIRYWAQQVGLLVSTLAFWTYLALTAWIIITGQLSFSPFWTGLGGIFWLEQQVTARFSSRKERLLALTLFPEMAYAFWLQLSFARAVAQIITRKESTWTHLSTQTA